ncbi:MAG: sulfite exporter TauE/SafE family protein [Kiloniellales bacterium]
MTYYLLVFVAGFAGSFHCVGMCGGFACALGRDPRGRSATVARHLLYNGGRVTTYLFLGALAGAAGQSVAHAMTSPLGDSVITGQRLLTIGAGLLMIVMALQLLGLLQRAHGIGFAGSTLAGSLRGLLAAPGAAAPLAFGVVNGFLPCPLVYAFVAQAASTADPLPAVLTMAAFGLGTFPAMLMMGGLGRLLQPVWRRRGVWIAGGFILLIGLITIARGLLPLADHGMHH